MGEGARFPKRVPVGISVGQPMDPPTGPEGKRVGRQQLRDFTAQLRDSLQELQDEARALVAP